MTSGLFFGIHGLLAQIVARTLGWMTAVATLIILAFIINQWSDKGSAVAAGLVGSGIAILNDSWIIFAAIERNTHGFSRLSPARGLLHDLFALAVSLGGLVMIIFSRYTSGVDALDGSGVSTGSYHDVISRQGFSQLSMLTIAVWMLTAVVIWRFLFVVWGCFDCFAEYRYYNAEQARRQLAEGRTRRSEV